MKISNKHSEPSASGLNKIDSQVLSLLNKLDSKPLLLEKIQLTASMTVNMSLNGNSLLKSLAITSLSPALLETILADANSVQLKRTGQSIQLIFLTANTSNKPDGLTSSPNQQNISSALVNNTLMTEFARLEFNGSKLEPNGHLALTHPKLSKQNTPDALLNNKVVDSKLAPLETSKTQQPPTTTPSKTEGLKHSPLLTNIDNRLTKLESNSGTINGSVVKVQQAFRELVESNVSPRLLELLYPNVKKQDALSQFIKLLSSLTFNANDKTLNQLAYAAKLSASLSEILKPSNRARSVSIQHRIDTSGLQMESKIGRADKLLVQPKDLPATKNIAEKTLGVLPTVKEGAAARFIPDIKLISTEFRRTFQQLNQQSQQGSNSILAINAAIVRLIEATQPQLLASVNNQTLPQTPMNSNNQADITASISEVKIPLEIKALIDRNGTTDTQWLKQLKSTLNFNTNSQFMLGQLKLIQQIINHSENIINRIEFNQLFSARSELVGLQQYLVDIPIMHLGEVESFELLFKSDKGDEDKEVKKKCWQVTIRFELEPLGPVFARVKFDDERISTRLYAKEAQTAQLIEDNIDLLEKSLFSAGLKIDSISGQQGVVPDDLVEQGKRAIDLRV